MDRPVAVIPTGIRLERFLPVSWEAVERDRREIREKYGIEEGKKVLLVLGRLAKEKNIEEIIMYFGRMNREDMELLIVGDGPCRKELEQLSDEQKTVSGFILSWEWHPPMKRQLTTGRRIFLSALPKAKPRELPIWRL